MAFTRGIRANTSWDFVKRIVLKETTSYSLWREKLTSILDAKDCSEIVSRIETEPVQITIANDANNALVN